MKRIIVGDTHGRSFWKLIKEQEWDEFIFIGDYFDSYEFSGLEQINNFKEIIEFKKLSEKPVILLIGNHDHHYFPEVGYSGTSGYQAGIHTDIEFVINENREHLRMAYAFDNVLCSHAGVGESWMERIKKNEKSEEPIPTNPAEIAVFVNSMHKYKPRYFKFTGRDNTGDDMGQTPIWIRPRSLMKDSQEMKKNGIIQVVGHTQQYEIDIKGKATGGKYFFIDTLGTSGEYLVWEDGKFNTKSVK